MPNGLFNLGGRKSLRIIDLAELVAERSHRITGSKVIVKTVADKTNQEGRFPLIWKINKLKNLGWEPNDDTVIAELDKTLNYCIEHFC